MDRIRAARSLARALPLQSTTLPSTCSRGINLANWRESPSRTCHRANFTTYSSCRAQVTSAGSSSTGTRTTTLAPDMSSSLDHLVPGTLFNSSNSTMTMSESLARQAVETILTQLRIGVDATSQEEIDQLQKEADTNVLKMLQDASISAESLHYFITQMLRTSKDPRRTPIAFRLFGIAFGIDPLQLQDPTANSASTTGLGTSLASIPIAGNDSWGVNAAGYSWASMVLSGQSPPPAGIHLLKRGSPEYIAALGKQQAAAVRVYATLAMRGDAQGMLGMGRILMAGTQRQNPIAGKSKIQSDLEMKTMRDRTIALWTKAGQMGIGDAWFELGLLYLGNSKGFEVDDAKSRQYFELGAKQGNFRCHHALGVMHTQAAMADNRSPSPPEREENLAKSLSHFTLAAEMGDPQSAHNLGLRYLLRDEMIDEIALGKENDGRTDEQVMNQAKQRHQSMWGVQANDVEARKWFEKAANFGSVPGMMNYAGMLVEGRGRTNNSPKVKESQALIKIRLEELKKAESLYSKVAAHGSVIAQQQQSVPAATGNKNTTVDQASGPQEVDMAKEMANFAQKALVTVQGMMKALVQEPKKPQV